MKTKIFGFFFLLALSAIFLLTNPGKVYATVISVTGKAKVLNTNNSYLDFTSYNSNVTVDDGNGNFSGYAFLEDFGWVAFGTTDNSLGPVNLNLTTGAVTGKAKALNTGAYLDFTNYNTNVSVALATGVFSGYVFSEDAGWISFSDTGVSSASPFLPTAPSGLSGTADSTTAITWSWTDNSSNETGFRVDDSSNNNKSGNLAAGTTSWQETGLSANTSYTRHVHAFNTAGDSSASNNATAVTQSSAPTSSNVTSDKSISTWYNTSSFTFTNGISGGFGGGISYFRYAWDTSLTHTWTGSETQWTSGTLTKTATSDSNSWYLHLKGYNSADTANGTVDLGPYYYDATAPASFDLDSPGDNSYTNSERPSFKWKATSDATSGLSKYSVEVDNGDSGDFSVDDIPTPRTTDYETNKYIIHYENFSDSDSTNNYISVYTKSSSEWSTDGNSGQNDGKVREGKISWKVKARDSAGNETSSSRTLFVDRTNPKVEFTQINETPFSSTSFSTTDKTPTIFGKITDTLAGADNNGQTKQDENGPKVASGPKQVEIKVEKKEGLAYSLVTLYKINMDNPYYTCDGGKTIDNNKQKCDKYLPFEYTPKESLALGSYKITLTGKDKADNTSSETVLSLNVTTFTQITTPEERQTIEEEIDELPKEERQKVKEELEITKPTEPPQPNVFEKTGEQITQTSKNVINSAGNFIAGIFKGIGSGISFIANAIGNGYSNIANSAPGFAKNILLAVGNGVNGIITGTKNQIANASFVVGEKTQGISEKVGFAFVKFGYLFVNEPTKIYDVQEMALTPTSIKISWETNHPANGKVNYGFKDGDYDFDEQSDKRTSHHEFTLSNLKPDTEYHYEVMSQNKNYVYDANRKFKTPAK